MTGVRYNPDNADEAEAALRAGFDPIAAARGEIAAALAELEPLRWRGTVMGTRIVKTAVARLESASRLLERAEPAPKSAHASSVPHTNTKKT